MSEAEWRYAHGVGPAPAAWASVPTLVVPAPRYGDRIYLIPDKDLVTAKDSPMGTGLDSWDF